MAFDGVFLHNLINEIRDNLIDGKIDKINQPEKDEIIVTLRKDRKKIQDIKLEQLFLSLY